MQNKDKKFEIGPGHLLLGGLSCVVHADRQGTQVACVGDLGLQFQGAVTIGVSFHGNWYHSITKFIMQQSKIYILY